MWYRLRRERIRHNRYNWVELLNLFKKQQETQDWPLGNTIAYSLFLSDLTLLLLGHEGMKYSFQFMLLTISQRSFVCENMRFLHVYFIQFVNITFNMQPVMVRYGFYHSMFYQMLLSKFIRSLSIQVGDVSVTSVGFLMRYWTLKDVIVLSDDCFFLEA